MVSFIISFIVNFPRREYFNLFSINQNEYKVRYNWLSMNQLKCSDFFKVFILD